MSTTRVLLSKQLAADAESHHPPLNFLERCLHATFPSEEDRNEGERERRGHAMGAWSTYCKHLYRPSIMFLQSVEPAVEGATLRKGEVERLRSEISEVRAKAEAEVAEAKAECKAEMTKLKADLEARTVTKDDGASAMPLARRERARGGAPVALCVSESVESGEIWRHAHPR